MYAYDQEEDFNEGSIDSGSVPSNLLKNKQPRFAMPIRG